MTTRREAIALTAGTAGMALGPQMAQAQRSVEPPTNQVVSEFLTFEDPTEEFRTYLRMGRDLVEGRGTRLTWYNWIVFIIPGDRRPMPFMRYEGMEYSYFRNLGDYNYRIHAHNVSFPRDLNTGKFIDTVVNPITEERVEVPNTVLLTDPGTVANPKGFRNLAGDGSYQHHFMQFRIEDNLLKFDSIRTAPPDWPATHVENSCTWAPFELYADESITSLPVKFAGHYAFEYTPWLKMPESHTQGHLTGFFDGRKINGPHELPQEFLDRMEREYPELLEPRWGEFDRPAPFQI